MALKIYTIPTAPIEENCYVAFDEDSKEGFIVDPGNEAEKIFSRIQGEGIKVQAILLTHGHWDHIGAVEELRQKLGVQVHIHGDDAAMLTDSLIDIRSIYGIRLEQKPRTVCRLSSWSSSHCGAAHPRRQP